MKKLLFLFIFLITSVLCSAQVQQFKAEAISMREYNDSVQVYNDWKPWKISDVIITYTPVKINIYSYIELEFTIISIQERILFEKGESIRFDAIDKNGQRCTIEFVDFPTDVYHLYIRWLDVQLVYQMKKL